MFRLRKSSEMLLRGRANTESEVSLYYKIGEASNIHNRARLLRTLTLAPICRLGYDNIKISCQASMTACSRARERRDILV